MILLLLCFCYVFFPLFYVSITKFLQLGQFKHIFRYLSFLLSFSLSLSLLSLSLLVICHPTSISNHCLLLGVENPKPKITPPPKSLNRNFGGPVELLIGGCCGRKTQKVGYRWAFFLAGVAYIIGRSNILPATAKPPFCDESIPNNPCANWVSNVQNGNGTLPIYVFSTKQIFQEGSPTFYGLFEVSRSQTF